MASLPTEASSEQVPSATSEPAATPAPEENDSSSQPLVLGAVALTAAIALSAFYFKSRQRGGQDLIPFSGLKRLFSSSSSSSSTAAVIPAAAPPTQVPFSHLVSFLLQNRLSKLEVADDVWIGRLPPVGTATAATSLSTALPSQAAASSAIFSEVNPTLLGLYGDMVRRYLASRTGIEVTAAEVGALVGGAGATAALTAAAAGKGPGKLASAALLALPVLYGAVMAYYFYWLQHSEDAVGQELLSLEEGGPEAGAQHSILQQLASAPALLLHHSLTAANSGLQLLTGKKNLLPVPAALLGVKSSPSSPLLPRPSQQPQLKLCECLSLSSPSTAEASSSGGGLSPAVSLRSKPRPGGFCTVAGNKQALQKLQDIVDLLRQPELFEAYGARMPRGVLLYGPPGTGKTLLARATAVEAELPLITVSASDFVEVYSGRGAARVRDLFKRARAAAEAAAERKARWLRAGRCPSCKLLLPEVLQRAMWEEQQQQQQGAQTPADGNGGGAASSSKQALPVSSLNAAQPISAAAAAAAPSPVPPPFPRRTAMGGCLVFMDEIDAIGRSRGAGAGGLGGSPFSLGLDNSNEEREQTLNALLAEMDGFWQDRRREGGGAASASASASGDASNSGASSSSSSTGAPQPSSSSQHLQHVNPDDLSAGRQSSFFHSLFSAVGLQGLLPGGSGGRSVTVGEELAAASQLHCPIIIIAATNRRDILDPALVRPGRFDRQVQVELPDAEGRKAILQLHCRLSGIPLPAGSLTQASGDSKGMSSSSLAPRSPSAIDWDLLAALTEGASGAVLEAVVNEAAMHTASRAAAEARRGALTAAGASGAAGSRPRAVGMESFLYAVQQVMELRLEGGEQGLD